MSAIHSILKHGIRSENTIWEGIWVPSQTVLFCFDFVSQSSRFAKREEIQIILPPELVSGSKIPLAEEIAMFS